ncbi:hypothetical protein [Glycomyces buryatensis]|uniref:Uncharacterized protein n=1 Tax=Glycomyces buryatensis TaxID=2570927 RepID=A0A4S8PZM8_9ACTN|nr:hypothetical protein [Glycomyces buryatensis]THV35635.1 hypothetical protein FAB82_22425 [Glycomyces buryatensis]
MGAIAGGAAMLAATGACTMFGEDSGGEDPAETVDAETAADLTQLVNETQLTEWELHNAERRILKDCMEDKGHTVHDEIGLVEIDTDDLEASVVSYPFAEWLPEPEDAEQWGFGEWAGAPEAQGTAEAEEYHNLRFGEEVEDESGPKIADNSEFEALSNEDRRAWYFDYAGEEYAEATYSGNYLTDDELQELWASSESEAGGTLDLGNPQPGGCLLEMIEALYGEPEFITEESEEGDREYWVWRPQAPIDTYEIDWGELEPEWSGSIQESQDALLDCLADADADADAGMGEWQFSEWGSLPVRDYWSVAYYGENSDESPSSDVPELPADFPTDYDGKKAAEIAMAVEFAECGDTSGFREDATVEWDRIHYGVYAEVETELYAWQEETDAALGRAQDLIAG